MPPADTPGPPRFGLSRPEFLTITAYDEGERALVEGVISIPALPVCRVQLRTHAERITRFGPGARALVEYVRASLCEDAVGALPRN